MCIKRDTSGKPVSHRIKTSDKNACFPQKLIFQAKPNQTKPNQNKTKNQLQWYLCVLHGDREKRGWGTGGRGGGGGEKVEVCLRSILIDVELRV